MIRYTKTKLNLFHHYFTHIIGNCIKPNFCPRDRRGTNNNTTRDKLCPLHFSMVFQECFYSFFLLVCKITAFSVYEIIQNLTLHPRDKERQSKIIAMDKPFLLQFNTVFGKWFYCFSLFWYAKFCPPFVPQKYSSKIYILIYNTLYNINIVCIGKVIDVICEVDENLEYRITTWFEIVQTPNLKQKTRSSRHIDPRWRYRRGLLIKKS